MSSSAVSKTNADKHPSNTFLCPLCCEETAACTTLSTCHHQSCKSCLAKWIEREEISGQTASPTCPFCRLAMGQVDVHAILERAFQPTRAVVAYEVRDDDDVGELTLHWLHEHTKLCQGCGSNIEKESGCDLVICLCGWRFCFNCGSHEGACECKWFYLFSLEGFQ